MLKSLNGKIFYREFECASPAAVMVLLHGLGGHSGRFSELGGYLSKSGIKTYAMDLNGFGQMTAMRGHIRNFNVFYPEVASLIEFAKKQFPGKKIFLLGECLGGLIALNFCIGHQSDIDGLILLSPLIAEKFAIPTRSKIEIAYNSVFNPMNYHYAFFEAKLFTRDPDMARKIDSDPLEIRSFSARTFPSILRAMRRARANADKIRLPMLMLLAGEDKMVPVKAASSYFERIPSPDKTLKLYPQMYHAMYLDLNREVVFKDIADWLKARH